MIKRQTHSNISINWLLAISLILTVLPLHAENLTFYIVAKNQADSNFIRVLDGCNAEAEKQGDSCVLAGPKQQAQPREQFTELKRVLESDNVNGIAISVLDSNLVKNAIKFVRVPVITFDSPLNTEHPEHFVSAHIGVDDEQIGRKLAQLAMVDYPHGGTVCIMTDDDPNLERRVEGVRLALSQNKTKDKLSGEAGWSESDRCPWLTADSAQRVQNEMVLTVEEIQPDVMISVGHWPVYFPDMVKTMLDNHLEQFEQGKPYLYSAIGDMKPYYSDLLTTGYVQAYVKLDFFQQGKLIYQTLKQRVQGKTNNKFMISSDVLVIKD